jgi:hypothetical protein
MSNSIQHPTLVLSTKDELHFLKETPNRLYLKHTQIQCRIELLLSSRHCVRIV